VPISGTTLAVPVITPAPSTIRSLGRLDVVLFSLSAVVVLDTLGAVAVGGGQAFTWMLVLFLTFFIPAALVSAELGAALPGRAGTYGWVRRAFGPRTGSIAALLYWAETPVWLGGSVAAVAVAVFGRFFTGLPLAHRYVFTVAFVLLATGASVIRLRWATRITAFGAVGQILLLVVFGVSVVAFALRDGVHGITAGDLAPSAGVFIAVVPVLIYSFVGVELSTNVGDGMRDARRDLPIAIGWAGGAQLLMFALPLLALLVVLPPDRLSSLSGLADALQSVFTVYGGSVSPSGEPVPAGLGRVVGWAGGGLLLGVLLTGGVAWIVGSSRTQAAACRDGGGPGFLGAVSARTGGPAAMTLTTGACAIVVAVVLLLVNGDDGQRYFSVALTVSIALLLLAYLLIFPAFLMLRLREPGLARPFRVPGGRPGAWAVTLLTTGWASLGLVCVVWPGLGTASPDSALPAGFEGQRAEFETLVLSSLGIVLLIGAAWQLFTYLRSAFEEYVPPLIPAARHVRDPDW
jgi:glutamate:GABA antiporter